MQRSAAKCSLDAGKFFPDVIVSLSNKLLLDIGVSLASSSSYSRLISALVTISSFKGVETVIVLLSEVFKGPIAALPATVFLGIVLIGLYNFRVISLGVVVCVFYRSCRSCP